MIKPRFLTRTFFDLYPNQDEFMRDFSVLGTDETKAFTKDEKDDLYMLIASKYGDSNIRYTNELLFKMNLFMQINTKYPMILAWKRDQKYLRDTELKKFQIGGRMVQNQGTHNTANLSTDTTEGINQLDAQMIVSNKLGELGVLQDKINAYDSGEELKFINGLKELFVVVIAPMADLLFGTLPEEED